MNVLERTEVQQPLRAGIPAQRSTPDGACLALSGELDLANVAQTAIRLQELVRSGARTIQVDVQDVTFLDLTTLRALLQTDEVLRARGGYLRLINPSRRVQRLLSITRTQHLLDGADSRATQADAAA